MTPSCQKICLTFVCPILALVLFLLCHTQEFQNHITFTHALSSRYLIPFERACPCSIAHGACRDCVQALISMLHFRNHCYSHSHSHYHKEGDGESKSPPNLEDNVDGYPHYWINSSGLIAHPSLRAMPERLIPELQLHSAM